MALSIIFYKEERGTEERGSVPLFEVDHHRHASETPFPWRFAGVAMMEPSDMVIFQGGGYACLSYMCISLAPYYKHSCAANQWG